MRKKPSETLAARVQSVLAEHGSMGRPMSLRAADAKTGVNYATIGRMADGFTPEMESVVKFAQGFGQDVDEWLEAYEFPTLGSQETGHQRLVRGLAELAQELGRPIPVSLDVNTANGMTVAQAEETLATLRRQADEGLF